MDRALLEQNEERPEKINTGYAINLILLASFSESYNSAFNDFMQNAK